MKLKQSKNKLKYALLKFVQFFVIIILVIIIFAILRGIYFRLQDERNISRGVEALKADVAKFDQENKDLNKLMEYFDSAEFQEKEIKEKLNLIKEGEKVVFIQGNKNDSIDSGLTEKQKSNRIVTVHANYYYWWKYFFGG